MATFLTPSQIQTQYLQILKSIKPSLNTGDVNSDFVIRGNAFSGLVSGLYGDQAKVYNDGFISSMRPEALLLKGADFGIPQQPATAAETTGCTITGPNGTIISINQLTFLYVPTNQLYTNTTGGTITGGTLTLSLVCLATGQVGNVTAPDVLTIVTPPAGVSSTANLTVSLADGADIESTDSYRARLLSREQSPPAGGNVTDYYNFAFAADPTVRSAYVVRFARGLGTVAVYITTGTTDVDTAVTDGDAIVRIPSSETIAEVQAYYNAHVPLTDIAIILAPTEVPINVTVNVDLASGLTLTSVPSDPVNNPLNLNVGQLIDREISRVLYKLPAGGIVLPGSTQGYVIASQIEAGLDTYLSAAVNSTTGLYTGLIPILIDREVQPLNGSSYNYPIAQNQLASPGTLTTVLGV